MEKNPYLMPAAVVIAGGMVGLGLFLGLRGGAPGAPAAPGAPGAPGAPMASHAEARPPSEPPGATAPVRSAPAAPAPPPEVRDAPQMPAVLGADAQAKVDQQIDRQLAARKAELARLCWAPSVAKSPSPATLQVVIRFLFDASGKQLHQSVAGAPDANRTDVTDCLQKQRFDLVIEPMGSNVASAVRLTFP